MLAWIQGSICGREMKNKRSFSINDNEIENKKNKKQKQKRLEPKAGKLA